MPKAIRNIDHYSGIGFPRGYNRLHSHTYDEISLLNQGDITYISDSIIDKVTGRSLIYSKAYQLHNPYVAPDKMYERSQIYIEPETVADLIPSFFSSVSSFIIALSDSEYGEISAFMALLASERGKNETAERFTVAALYTRLSELSEKNSRPPEKITNTYINEVIYYIENHFTEHILSEDLAARFFVSRTKLMNDFKKTTGLTINAFFTLTRLKNAKKYLDMGYSVSKTAELTGYLSTGHFINVFVSHNNITPLKYRQMRKEKNFLKKT